MAFIFCKECGNQISDKAERCPYCGIVMYNIQPPRTYDMMTSDEEKEEKLKKRRLIGLVVFILGFIFRVIISNVDMGGGELQLVLLFIVEIVSVVSLVISIVSEVKLDKLKREKYK